MYDYKTEEKKRYEWLLLDCKSANQIQTLKSDMLHRKEVHGCTRRHDSSMG